MDQRLKQEVAVKNLRTPENTEGWRGVLEKFAPIWRATRNHSWNNSQVRAKNSSQRSSLPPYNIQIVQALNTSDYGARVPFCQEMQDLIGEDDDLVNNIWMSDEAHFHVSGFVNKQNFCYWSQANPWALHEKPLHSQKVTVWCTMSASGIIGPYFFEKEAGYAVTVNADCYVEICKISSPHNSPVFPVNENTLFQHDGATSHSQECQWTQLMLCCRTESFPGMGITMPTTQLADLNPCDYFLWGTWKKCLIQGQELSRI